MEELERFKKQMDFILEIDKAKNIFRQTYVSDSSRKENDAEHSWHIAIMAFVLAEYFPHADIPKVMKMTLMHDIVEIDAGDTYCYDLEGYSTKADRESLASARIYGLLPDDQKLEFQNIWEEFEAGETQEAKFAEILDRLQPIMLNHATNGKAWLEHSVLKSQAINRNAKTLAGPAVFADFLLSILNDAEERGWLKKD